MYEFIPEELKRLRNWVCWKAEPDPKAHSGISKKPINPFTGGQAQSNNPDTWADFETAVRVSSDFAGIGFMFDKSGYFGVDLDDMPEALADFLNGGTNNVIAEFVNTLQSYTEFSQSKTGIHIICRGRLPEGRRRSGKFEMYDSGRFFVMTGDYCSEFINISDGTEAVKPLHDKYLMKGKNNTNSNGKIDFSHPGGKNLSLSANEIIEKARNSQNGSKFEALYKGEISGYASQSEADMAFCNMLAFWCGRDVELMDSIYRSSGLMRSKWDRKQSGSTYGMLTLQKAVSTCQDIYSPQNSSTYSISVGSKQSKKKKLYSFDDTGNAERIFDNYGYCLKYSYVDKRWLYYRDGKWNYDNIGEIYRVVDAALEIMKNENTLWVEHEGGMYYDDFKKHLKKTRSNNAKKAMIKELEHHVPILPKNMDTDKMLVNCKNGIIDLAKGQLISHNAEKFMTKMLNVPFNDNVGEPVLWLNFLNDIFNNDRELIRYIQKASGYSLSGLTSEQCVFFLYGTGRNGKSTFLEIIRYIMGDYATNIQPETIMVKPSGSSANSDIARLKGARLVTSVEPNEGMRINEGLLKQLTGDDIVTARKLYGDEFEFKPEFKLWMATNHKPIIRGTDTGIWRRIHIIPFTVSIPKEKVDKNLKYKLKAELPSILSWMAEGFRLWQSEGLDMPKVMKDAVDDYRHEMDVISAFTDACCITEGEVRASVIYAAYSEWASENNEYRMSSTKFGAELSKRFEKFKGKGGCVYYKGITISEKQSYSVSIG